MNHKRFFPARTQDTCTLRATSGLVAFAQKLSAVVHMLALTELQSNSRL